MRDNDRYTELSDEESEFGDCPAKDIKDAFEPPDCLTGDVARIWLYMGFRHGVEISDDERTMFERWSMDDPVSPWESEREKRIAKRTFVINPLVHDVAADVVGACPWE